MVTVALMLLLGNGTASVSVAAELTGAPAPDFVLKSLSGQNMRLSELRGEVVLLSFWATWCGECRAQLVELGAWYGRYHGAGFELLAISLDRDWSDIGETAEALSLPYPVLADADLTVSRLYEVTSMPVSILIDRDGVVREVIHGFRRGRGQSDLDLVRELLRE
jgi:peroxiredoxin